MKPDEVQRLQNFLYDRLYNSALNNVGYKCNAEDVFMDIADNRLKTWLHDFYSDMLKINKEDPAAFKVGDIVRIKDTDPKLDDCDVAVVTWVSERSTYIYVMRSDGSCGMEEDLENWYKVGHITWFADYMKDLKNILEEY